jgi:uncharacterized protein involved in exopolysaccharide biosynthesis
MQQYEIGSTISVTEIAILAYLKRKKLLLALVTPIVLAILLVIIMPPVYRAQTDLMVKTGREFLPQGEGESAMAAPTSTKQEDINSEIEVLTSRSMMIDAINGIGMDKLFPGLSEDPPMFDSVIDTAVKRFTSKLSVDPVKLSNVISVSYDADTPEEAASTLDQFISIYQARHAAIYSGGRSASYEQSIKTALSDLEALERRKTQIKLENKIYDIAQQRAALISQRVDADAKVQDTISNKSTLEKRIGYLSDTRTKVPAFLPPALEMQHVSATLTDLEQAETEMSARFGPANPDLIRIREQIRTLQHNMGGLKGELSGNSLTPSPLAQQIDQELVMDHAELAPLDDELKRELALRDSLDAELSRVEKADLELRTIGTQIDSLNDNLKALQARYDQSRTEDDMDRSKVVSVVQVEKANAPDKPAQPKPLLYIAGGLVVGLLISGGMVVFSAVTNNRIYVAHSVERLVGLPVLASIPILPTAPKLIALPRNT